MSSLRPDEMAMLSSINREQSTNRFAKGALNTALGIGAAATGSAILTPLAQRLAPLLNEFIPQDLAMKGISKISPKLGEFLKKGEGLGLDVKEGLNFLKDRLAPTKPEEKRNVIQQYSDKLHAFLEDQIKKGRKPLEAAAIARTNKEFEQVIKKLEKDHKTNWSNIIESIYGIGEQAPQMAAGEEQMTAPIQQPTQQPGAGQQALMQILQKINQVKGGGA